MGTGRRATAEFAAPTSQIVSASPAAPPTIARTRLSVSNCRRSRRRPAPSASLTATSRWRAVARLTSRPAIFAHPISSTNPDTTAMSPRNANTGRRMPDMPRNASTPSIGTTTACGKSSGRSGCSSFSCAVRTRSAAVACWWVTDGLSRPTTSNSNSARSVRLRLGVTVSTGDQKSGWRPGGARPRNCSRHDADHFERPAADRQALTKNRRRRSEPNSPHVVR